MSPSSTSPERLFNSVGPVKSDLWGRLLDTTLIDVMWGKQDNKYPKQARGSPHNTLYLHTTIYVTNTHQYLSLEHTNMYRTLLVDLQYLIPGKGYHGDLFTTGSGTDNCFFPGFRTVPVRCRWGPNAGEVGRERECPLWARGGSGGWFWTPGDLATTGSGVDACFFPGFRDVPVRSRW